MPSPPVETPPPGLTSLLEALVRSGVEFILVGGLAAVAQGAPLATFDVDVVHARLPANVDALLAFLASIHARYRGRTDSPVPISRDALVGPGHSLFTTDLGPLDVLGAIEGGLDYAALLPETLEVDLRGVPLRVLSLEAIVRIKRGSAHPKDRLALPVLEEALRQSRFRSG